MKKTSLIFTFLFLINLVCAAWAGAAPIYSYTEEIPISESILLTKVQQFHAGYNLSYSYIKADLSDENTSLKLLTSSKGTDVLDTVKNLATAQGDTVAALNADFFSTQANGKGFSLGVQIKDGSLLQSPIDPSSMATVAYMDNLVQMSYLDFHIMAVAPNWNYNEIRHLNKHTTYYGDILMYTADFNGGYSPAPGGEVLEVVVEDGKIKELRRNMPPVQIPENGCVLVVSEGVNMFFANNFNVGDPIKFDYYITPNIAKADAAFGGGAMLVSDGKKVKSFSHTVAGYQPRSAIGTDKSGKTLYMVAVDGRQDSSRGMTMSELADLMIELGCYSAVNLDGGGSTNMQASTVWYETMHAVHSPTENRKVINAVGLSYSAETDNQPSGILLENEKNVVFLGDSVKITSAVYDKNLRPLDQKLTWSSKHGTVQNGVFTPNVGGTVRVEATCQGASAQTELYVIDTVSGIEVPSHLYLPVGKTEQLQMHVFDALGHYTEVINPQHLRITSSDTNIVSVSGKTLRAHESGTAVVCVKAGEAAAYISVAVGEAKTDAGIKYMPAPADSYLLPAPKANEADFVVAALQTEKNTLLTGLVNRKINDYVLSQADYALLGEADSFSAHEDEHALYIRLRTDRGGIRNSDATQWTQMTQALNNSEKDAVFLLTNDTVFGNSDFENRVLCDYLSDLDKNVYVISAGAGNTYKNIDGVHFFTIKSNANELLNLTALENYKALEFYFGETITFAWKSLFA